ncbi:A disintegrin and metalloproteinase with thrombospondin motifs 9 [Camelus dromedarius]|uniref:A disintegrin and metalloproteinase with thrombospondin motifs 9 n=1 Tax=Camelus dromedarius TaxID=9838 RepID=A0A5N4CZF9_CAMDR|nr:A disintegrin and metalloproteinase with thrombospondin motifs 9 [Camelus dromedarius]
MEVPVTDGSWGSWSHFGTCSRTCGGGIKTAVRECNRPEPKNGGKYCVGRRMKFKSCNTEPCLKQKRDFRDEQCAHFDGKHFNINGLLPNVRWVPKYSGSYNIVVRIPAGATNIDVRQHSFSGKSEDDNYLALSSSKGEFLLNGDFVVTMSKREIRIGNAIIEYSGSDNVVERINSTDRIEQELLLQVLSVGKLYNPDVRYSFNIPIEDKPQQFYWNSQGPWQACSKPCQGERKRKPVCTRESDQLPVSDQRCDQLPQPAPITEPCGTDCDLRWHVASRSECSAQCGLGYRTLDIYCAKYSRLDGKTEKIDDSFCSSHPKPSNREKCSGECNTGGWRYSAWTECLVTCGKGHKHRQVWCQFGEDRLNDRCSVTCGQGYQLRAVKCIIGTYMSVVDDNDCNAATRPTDTQCSSTCAGGSQRRVVVCQDENGYTANDCVERIKPDEQRACESGPCPQWAYGNWGECTKLCGRGLRTRLVVCQRPNGERFPDLSCEILDKPPDREQCNTHACPQDAAWSTGPWSSVRP